MEPTTVMFVRVLVILVVIFVMWALASQYSQAQARVRPALTERFQASNGTAAAGAPAGGTPQGYEPSNNEDYQAVDFTGTTLPNDCFPKDRLTAEDLLPKDAANSKWAQVNPAGQGDVKDGNWLDAGYHMGVDTVGTSLRNANMQLRADPIVEMTPVSPWMQSTIGPDYNRKPLE